MGDKARPGSPTRRDAAGWIAGAAVTAFCAPGALAQSSGATDLDALIKAAKAEGEFLYYMGLTDNVAKRVSEAFQATYGIKTQVVRLDGSVLVQRYEAEAEAGSIPADLVIVAGGADELAQLGEQKGWIEPISAAQLPVLKSSGYPAKFNRGRSALVQISPWLIAYNTDKVKSTEVPKNYSDLFDPKWKGQVLVNDPVASLAFVDFWALLFDRYGPKFFEQLRQNIRPIANPVQGIQSLGAGEGSFFLPAVIAQVLAVKNKGAPLETVTMDLTTGVQSQVILTAPAKAKHPNAARLFANWALSPEGNKVVNDDPGNFTLYDSAKLPKEYESPKPGSGAARKDEIRKLLGFA